MRAPIALTFLAVLLLLLALGAVMAPGARAQDQPAIGCILRQNSIDVFRAKHPNGFLVSPFGELQAQPPRAPDESDEFTVGVYAPNALMPYLVVRRISGTRDVDAYPLRGIEAFRTLKEPAVADSDACAIHEAVVGSFAPGTGIVQIGIVNTKTPVAKIDTLSRFSFPVARRYQGALSLGPVYVFDPQGNDRDGGIGASYGLLGDSTIYEQESGRNGVHYAIGFTPFALTGPLRFDGVGFLDTLRVNPFVGFVLAKPLDHVLAGLTLDFAGGTVLLHVGVHAGRRTRLAEGLSVGNTFKSGAANIPTRRDWYAQRFAGVTFDLRGVLPTITKALNFK